MLYLSALLIIYTACSKPEENLVFNIRDLIGKDEQGVIAVLGRPDSSYDLPVLTHDYFIQYYKNNAIEIRHLHGHVAEVIVNNPGDLTFDPQTIRRFGLLSYKPTTIDTSAMIIWKNIPDLKSVTFYKEGSNKTDPVKPRFKIYFNLK